MQMRRDISRLSETPDQLFPEDVVPTITATDNKDFLKSAQWDSLIGAMRLSGLFLSARRDSLPHCRRVLWIGRQP